MRFPARFREATSRAYLAFVQRVLARPGRSAALLVLVCLPSLALDIQFFSHVRAELQELLPPKAPIVKALEEIHRRFGGQSHVTVIVKSPDPAANRRFITEFAARLKARQVPEVRRIQSSVAAERQWLIDHGALLMADSDFEPLAAALEDASREAKARANPLLFDPDDEGSQAFDRSVERVRSLMKTSSLGRDRFASGFMESPDGTTVVALVWLQGSEVEFEPARDLLRAVAREVAELKTKFPANLSVLYNGEVPNMIEEHDAILSDLSISSLLVLVLVGSLIVLYFRSVRGVLAILLGLIPGLLFTFAIGRLTVHSLNSNTAFLGSIIAGNGINYPILFLAYYRARSPSLDRAHALVQAAALALPGTLGAAATASAAYGGLAVSDFRGFSQFGWLGGLGMLTTWAFTFLTMPLAIALLDPPRAEDRPTWLHSSLLWFFSRRWLPWSVALGFVALATAGSVSGIRKAQQDGLYEMNLRALRNRESPLSGGAARDQEMSRLFGVWLNPVVALVSDPAMREPAAAEFRRVLETGDPPMAERIETMATYVPPAPTQEARLKRLGKIAGLVRKLPRDRIPPEARPILDAWFAPENLQPITEADVPPTLKQDVSEQDGSSDRSILIFPSLKHDFDDGTNVLRFADRLAETRLPPATVVGGGFLFMAEILRLVGHEGVHVILVVFLLVSLVLIPMFLRHPLRMLVGVPTIGAVAITAQAIMLALGMRVNMLNFAAVPITIGVGADYLVNLFGAMDAYHEGPRRACARMGGAIWLCSLTTTVGYLSLVFAESGALRTFGWAAVLGEMMAVTTVLLVLPVFGERRLSLAPGSAPYLAAGAGRASVS